jgi:hypothetical protein
MALDRSWSGFKMSRQSLLSSQVPDTLVARETSGKFFQRAIKEGRENAMSRHSLAGERSFFHRTRDMTHRIAIIRDLRGAECVPPGYPFFTAARAAPIAALMP